MEFQGRKGRNDSLTLESEKHLENEKKGKRKKTKGQLPLAPKQHAPEADTLQETGKAFSKPNTNPP